MKLEEIDIEFLVPQRSPFIMVDKLIEYKNDFARTSLLVTPENILVQDGLFSEEGMVENMAQTAATFLGYESYLKGLDAPVGFIAAIKHLKVTQSIAQNAQIYTSIKFSNTILNINIVDAMIEQDGKVVAEAELRIYIDKK